MNGNAGVQSLYLQSVFFPRSSMHRCCDIFGWFLPFFFCFAIFSPADLLHKFFCIVRKDCAIQRKSGELYEILDRETRIVI